MNFLKILFSWALAFTLSLIIITNVITFILYFHAAIYRISLPNPNPNFPIPKPTNLLSFMPIDISITEIRPRSLFLFFSSKIFTLTIDTIHLFYFLYYMSVCVCSGADLLSCVFCGRVDFFIALLLRHLFFEDFVDGFWAVFGIMDYVRLRGSNFDFLLTMVEDIWEWICLIKLLV